MESAQDIAEELASLLGSLAISPEKPSTGHTSNQTALDPDYARLLEAMGFDPISVDELIGRTGLTPNAVSSMLLLLELDGHVSSIPGGYYCRSGTSDSRDTGREEA